MFKVNKSAWPFGVYFKKNLYSMLNSGIISIDIAFSYYFIFEGERIFFMSISIPENFGKELDELLTPILGNHFHIERNHHGVYFIHASSGHVFSIHSTGHENNHAECETHKCKTS